MMRVEIHQEANDVLRVLASWTETPAGAETEVERQAEATGWVSATTNHYDPAAYGANGHLDPKAEPRTLDAGELRAYALRLLVEQNLELPIPGRAAKAAEPVQSFEL